MRYSSRGGQCDRRAGAFDLRAAPFWSSSRTKRWRYGIAIPSSASLKTQITIPGGRRDYESIKEAQ
jgi:hypothetical protein